MPASARPLGIAIAGALALGPTPAAAQFLYDTRWFIGLRENTLELQRRHRERIEELRALREETAQAPTFSDTGTAPSVASATNNDVPVKSGE